MPAPTGTWRPGGHAAGIGRPARRTDGIEHTRRADSHGASPRGSSLRPGRGCVPGRTAKAQQWRRPSPRQPPYCAVPCAGGSTSGAQADSERRDSRRRFFDILRPHRKVNAILYGHSHRYAYDVWEGVPLMTLPAIGYNFNDDQPVGWVDVKLTATGGAFTLRALGGSMEKDGKTVAVAWRA